MEQKDKDNLVREAFQLVETKAGTNLEKSRTAFLSFSMQNGSITFSVFLARVMGFTSGDRLALIQSKENKLKFLIAKTRQRYETKEVRINKGVFKVNNLKWVKQIGDAFRFNPEYKQLIRLYVNMEEAIPIPALDNAKALQLFDIPVLREDFASEEEKQEYIDYVNANPYIIKLPKKDE